MSFDRVLPKLQTQESRSLQLNPSLSRLKPVFEAMESYIQRLDEWLSDWPLRFHLALATALLGLTAVVGGLWISHSRARFDAAQAELTAALALSARATPASETASSPSISPASRASDGVVFPEARISGAVLAFLIQVAQKEAVTLHSVTRHQTVGTPNALGRTQIVVTAAGEYGSVKHWVAQALARYPALGLDSVTLKNGAADGSRQDVQVGFTLYTRD